MEPFTLIAQNFWVIAILFTSINFLIFKDKAKGYIKQNPELSNDYEKLFQHYFFWFNIPWIIMGIGIVTGGVSNIAHYFRPQDGNPFVLLWYISIFSLWVVGTYWLVFKGGAEMIIKCPGALKGNLRSPLLIKVLWLICIFWGGCCCGIPV
ncbi:MAG: hypothetical protein KAS13_04705 [Candidatus Omnitrophica bacterium]|nr:hypothetical protein [Candidatus Omnitrophota bacterium]